MHRKPLAAIAAALSVLALAGMAFAHGGGPSSVQATSATFVATTVADSKSDTCTGADGTYTRTRATYTGTATSTDARLAGAMELRATTVYNATTNLGVVDGHFRVQTATGHTDGRFRAVDTGGSLFIAPRADLYEGMVVGENSRENDLDVNASKEKKLTNMRSATADELVRLIPPRPLSLEQALEFIADDECVEVTPKGVRLRKVELNASKRASATSKRKREAAAAG